MIPPPPTDGLAAGQRVTMTVRPPQKRGACSAVGSAPEWHSGGHRFDPGQVHQPPLMIQAEVVHRSSLDSARAKVDRSRPEGATVGRPTSWISLRCGRRPPFAPSRTLPSAYLAGRMCAVLDRARQRVLPRSPAAAPLSIRRFTPGSSAQELLFPEHVHIAPTNRLCP